ncbi:MAG: PilZ domain-containing protein [Kiloniellales bacterium]
MEQTGCVSELRKHRRIVTRKAARLSVDEAWHDCVILDVSSGGAKVVVDQTIAPGTAVVLAEGELGFLAGVVQRNDDDGVSVSFGVGPEARSALIDRLAGFLSSDQQP